MWNSPLLGPLWARLLYLVVVPFLVWALLSYLRTEEHLWFTHTLAQPGALGEVPPAYLTAVGATWWKRRAYRAGVAQRFGQGSITAQRVLEAQLTDLADAVDVGDAADASRLRGILEERLVSRS